MQEPLETSSRLVAKPRELYDTVAIPDDSWTSVEMSIILTTDVSEPAEHAGSSCYNPKSIQNENLSKAKIHARKKVRKRKKAPKAHQKPSDMKLLSKQRLEESLPWLESQFPKISPVYHLAVNLLECQFEWPGMGMFTSDKTPQPSVVIYKPIGSQTHHSYNPVFSGCLRVFIYAHSAGALKATMEKDPNLLDWKMPIIFMDLDRSLLRVICGQRGIPGTFKIVTPVSGMRTGEKRFWFDLQEHKVQWLPYQERFHMGRLSPRHLNHIKTFCGSGSPWKRIFSHMLSRDFWSLSVALFVGSKSGEPVAYCMYMPHGCIGAVYVDPKYPHLFRVVLLELLNRLKNMDYMSVWMDTGSLLFPLEMDDILSPGGRGCKGERTCWLMYTPGKHNSRGRLQREGEPEEDLSAYVDTEYDCYEEAVVTVKASTERTVRSQSYSSDENSPRRSGRRKSLHGSNERGFTDLQEDPYERWDHEE